MDGNPSVLRETEALGKQRLRRHDMLPVTTHSTYSNLACMVDARSASCPTVVHSCSPPRIAPNFVKVLPLHFEIVKGKTPRQHLGSGLLVEPYDDEEPNARVKPLFKETVPHLFGQWNVKYCLCAALCALLVVIIMVGLMALTWQGSSPNSQSAMSSSLAQQHGECSIAFAAWCFAKVCNSSSNRPHSCTWGNCDSLGPEILAESSPEGSVDWNGTLKFEILNQGTSSVVFDDFVLDGGKLESPSDQIASLMGLPLLPGEMAFAETPIVFDATSTEAWSVSIVGRAVGGRRCETSGIVTSASTPP